MSDRSTRNMKNERELPPAYASMVGATPSGATPSGDKPGVGRPSQKPGEGIRPSGGRVTRDVIPEKGGSK
jgi:hypothetical protein